MRAVDGERERERERERESRKEYIKSCNYFSHATTHMYGMRHSMLNLIDHTYINH